MFKIHEIKSNHRIRRKNEVDTGGAPVFALDYNNTVLVTKMCNNFSEHSIYIWFLWIIVRFKKILLISIPPNGRHCSFFCSIKGNE
jgi:hypothetical protein